MYISYLLLLKLFTLVTVLSFNDDNVNTETVSSYPNHPNSFLYSATLPKRATEQSDRSRIEFQIRNHQGPGTYIFGFDTGDGKNRQYRLEQRLRDGSIKGRYGFYDMKGKLKIINYVAGPNNGYQERHHETIRPET